MRSEKEMYQLILDTARNDNRILAVYMNGSRANPNVKKDIFQDYDIVYVVKETASFIKDTEWNTVFGAPIIFQEPDMLDKMQGRNVDFDKGYTYLMQFTDGNRIDLHLLPVSELAKEYGNDKLTVPLLDKDHYLPQIAAPSDEDYWVKKPSYGVYYSRCNDFWWVAPYCAKGLWRQEILYTIDTMNQHVRKELLNVLRWYAGIMTDFKVSMGKSDKYLKHYVDENTWDKLMKTFQMGNYDCAWDALITTCELFDEYAVKVGVLLGYEYNKEEAERSFSFVRHIKELPKDASEIY